MLPRSTPSQSSSSSSKPSSPPKSSFTSDTSPRPTTRNRCRPRRVCTRTTFGSITIAPPRCDRNAAASSAASTTFSTRSMFWIRESSAALRTLLSRTSASCSASAIST